MERILRHPLLHFLLLGGLLFVARQWLPAHDATLQTIQVSAGELRRLQTDWARETGRAPSAAELQASLQRHLDEEILLREALKLGLESVDPVARERLVQNMRFAFPESDASDEALLAEARALGLHRRDLVVRRRLAQVMAMRAVGQASFSEAELRDYVSRNPVRYASPARYAFRQVFVSGDRPPGQAERIAQALLARLQAQDASAVAAGDPFLLGAVFPPQSAAELDRAFGPGFGAALAALAPGAWAGPLRSAYGLHLVRIERVEAGAAPDFAQMRARAAYALLAEREKAVLQEALTRLRAQYRVQLPDTGPAAQVTLGMAP
ncbi:MAG TPA: peptidylprolyl isomerase [Nevskiales bacterium]|nr:peptidylprolyl isomerase [Nevskiales bacterium]